MRPLQLLLQHFTVALLRLLFTMHSSGPSHVELHVVVAGVYLFTELQAHPPQSTGYMISIYIISKSNLRNINTHILYTKISLWDAAFSCSQSVCKKTIYERTVAAKREGTSQK